MSQKTEAFIEKISPFAQEVQEKYGVPASLVIAQAAQETGWGEHVKGNNYFGIKQMAGYQSAAEGTHEYINGQKVGTTANFSQLADLHDSVLQYGKLLSTHGRYAGVLNATNADDAANAVAAAGYATDPGYAAKLKQIIHDNNLPQYDDQRFQNYTATNQSFDSSMQRLDDERSAHPAVWSSFLQGLMDIIKQLSSTMSDAFNTQGPGGGTPTVPARRGTSVDDQRMV